MPTNYYDIPALSYSGIKKYLTDGAHSFWRHSTFNPNRIPEPTTKFILAGKVAHKLLLEPTKFQEEFIIAPDVDRRTKEGKAIYAEFESLAEGKAVIGNDLYQEINNSITALKANEQFKEMTKGDWLVEEEFFWEVGGIKRKAKTDLIVADSGTPVIFDYKRCANCEAAHFAKDIIKFKYYIQSVYYKSAFEAKYGGRPRFVFIAQEWDYPENIAFYELLPADEAVGEREIARASKEIKDRLLSGDWSAAPKGINKLDLPTWFYTRQQEEELDAVSESAT